MCKVLLSINPEYVDMIFSGIKKYEFRKCLCRRPIDRIVIYCTAPVMKVVGEATVVDVLVDDPKHMWRTVKRGAGISKEFFDAYYENRKNAVAYRLGEVYRFEKPLDLDVYGIKHAPQSFAYVKV